MTQFEQPRKLPQYVAALSVCLGAVAAGTVLGWTANLNEDYLKNGEFNDIVIEPTDGWIGSCATLGAMLMCFPIGWICDWIGRKTAMLLTVFPFTLGWLLIIFSENIGMIYAGRFFTGLAGGAFCVAAPMYTTEIAEVSIRGSLGSYFQLLLTVGILFSYVMAWAVDMLVYCIILSIIPIIFVVVFFLQPETPLYLLRNNKDDEARKALIKLRGTSKYDIDSEIKQIKAAIDEQRSLNISLKDSFKKKSTRKATLICFSLMFFQQLSGINAVVFYTSNILEAANVPLESSHATIIIGCAQVLATFVASLTVEKLGRRVLLLLSDILMAVSIIMLGIYFTLNDRIEGMDPDTLETLGFIPIIALSVFMIVFSLGFGPIPWMISAELFPPEVKAFASSAAGTFNWLLAFIVTTVYKPLIDALDGGDYVFYFFGGVSIVGTVFIWFVVPETKGKSLEHIQQILNGEKPSNAPISQGVNNEGFSKE